MHIQLIRNAIMRMTYGNKVFITDPFFAPKHAQEPLIGKSRNPIADLPFPPEEVLADIEMALIRICIQTISIAWLNNYYPKIFGFIANPAMRVKSKKQVFPMSQLLIRVLIGAG